MLFKINRIRKIEPNKNIIIAGDFNLERQENSELAKRMWKKLKAMKIEQVNRNLITCKRH